MRRVEDNAPGAPELAGRQSSGRPLLCGEESCGIEPDRAAPMRGGEQRNENDLPVAWIAQVDSLGGAGSTGVLPTMDAMLAELGAKGRRKLQGPGKRVSTSATLSRKSVSFLHFIRCEFNECAVIAAARMGEFTRIFNRSKTPILRFPRSYSWNLYYTQPDTPWPANIHRRFATGLKIGSYQSFEHKIWISGSVPAPQWSLWQAILRG